MNKARISAMSMIICALCKVQQVAYTKLASAFDTTATPNSSLRRIQRLIAQCVLDTDLIAKLILKLIPVSGPYTLAMFAIIMIAYVWCYLVGIYINNHIKAIKVLKHGRRAVSLFKYGLDYIADYLMNHRNRYRIDMFKFLSYT